VLGLQSCTIPSPEFFFCSARQTLYHWDTSPAAPF
jgi:hypothetical protein